MTGGAAAKYATPRNPARKSWGPAVAAMAQQLGKPLMPWQRQVVDVALEVDDDGLLVYNLVTVTTPRQAGKSTLLQPLLAQKAQAGRNVWMTAQTGKSARRRWLAATDPLVSKLNTGPRIVNRNVGVGIEELRWIASSGVVTPFAPNAESMHGETPDDVMLDEVWVFKLDEASSLQQAYSPGFQTRDDPQEWLTSTQGDAGSEWLSSLTRAGRESVGRPDRMAYFEWSMPRVIDGTPVVQLSDDALVAAIVEHHPATKFWPARLRELRKDLAKVHDGTMTRVDLIRAWGNLASADPAGAGVWPGAVWTAAGTDLAPVGAVGLGVHVDPDGRGWALTAAGRATGGQVVLEVVTAKPGAPGPAEVAYVRDVVGRQKPTAVYGIGEGAAADFLDLLESGGVRVQRITAADLGAANSRVLQGVAKLTVLHRKQPELDQAQKAGVVRESGNRRLLARSGTAPVASLQAGVLAAWALDHPDGAHGPFRIMFGRVAS